MKQAKANRVLSKEHANTLFQQPKRRLYIRTSANGQYQNDYVIAAEDGAALYSQQKQDQELTVAQIMNSYCQIQIEIEENRENHQTIQV